MQPRFKSEMNGQGVKHTRLQGKVASEFRTFIVFPPYRFPFGTRTCGRSMYGYGRGTLSGFLPSSTLPSEKSFVSAATGAITLFQVGTGFYYEPRAGGGPALGVLIVGR